VETTEGSIEVTLPEFVPNAKKGFRWRVIKGNCVESDGEAKREDAEVEYMCFSVFCKGEERVCKKKRGFTLDALHFT